MSSDTSPNRADILALETAYWDAMKAKDGGRTAELAGDPSLVTGARGVMSIPRSRMGAMTEEGEWTLDAYDFEQVEVLSPAPNVAIIAYVVSQTVTMDGEQKTMRAADSSTWVKGEDGWACHGHNECFLPDKTPD